MSSLEHRVSAADHYDDRLAEELSAAALAAAGAAEFRQASYLYRWSSIVTSDAALRVRRWLDSLFESVLARDLAVVRLSAEEIQLAPDTVRRSVVIGALLNAEKNWSEAVSVLSRPTEEEIAATDSLSRYRLFVLLLQARLGVGDESAVLASLALRADAEPARDLGLSGHHYLAAGQIAMRHGRSEEVLRAFTAVPATAADSPITATFALAWRGSVSVYRGMSHEAEADLAEVTSRIRRGLVSSTGDGIYDALLGFARWQSGSWNRASVDVDIAMDSVVGTPHPAIRAIAPMVLAVRGDFVNADKQLDSLEQSLRGLPWREVVHLYIIARVVWAHAEGDWSLKRSVLSRLKESFGPGFAMNEGFVGGFVLLHLAFAAMWAGDADSAERYIDLAAVGPLYPDWMGWGESWLRALVSECRGHPAEAMALLERAVAVEEGSLPLYRAHALVDLARLADATGDGRRGLSARVEALSAYRSLGAVPYVSRLVAFEPAPRVGVVSDVLQSLSTRERDVATLAVSGLSYAQIARELYLSKSTVSFHLTNIYAKTGVETRHGLIDLVRTSEQPVRAHPH